MFLYVSIKQICYLQKFTYDDITDQKIRCFFVQLVHGRAVNISFVVFQFAVENSREVYVVILKFTCCYVLLVLCYVIYLFIYLYVLSVFAFFILYCCHAVLLFQRYFSHCQIRGRFNQPYNKVRLTISSPKMSCTKSGIRQLVSTISFYEGLRLLLLYSSVSVVPLGSLYS